MNAQRSLMASSRELQSAMERLSTGKKINSAADDAAGFAIAESMTAQVRGLSMAAKMPMMPWVF
jgi:flagellin